MEHQARMAYRIQCKRTCCVVFSPNSGFFISCSREQKGKTEDEPFEHGLLKCAWDGI